MAYQIPWASTVQTPSPASTAVAIPLNQPNTPGLAYYSEDYSHDYSPPSTSNSNFKRKPIPVEPTSYDHDHDAAYTGIATTNTPNAEFRVQYQLQPPRLRLQNQSQQGQGQRGQYMQEIQLQSPTHSHSQSHTQSNTHSHLQPNPHARIRNATSNSRQSFYDWHRGSMVIKKWSKMWFRTTWNRAVEIGRWPRVFYSVTGVILMTTWVCVMLIFINHESRFQRKNLDLHSEQSHMYPWPGDWVIQGALRRFDPDFHILTVDWSMTYAVTNDTYLPLGDTADSYQVGVFVNGAARVDNSFDYANLSDSDRQWLTEINSPRDQIFKVDNGTTSNTNINGGNGGGGGGGGNFNSNNGNAGNGQNGPDAIIGLHSWDGFSTDIVFDQKESDDPWRQPMFGYPWDQWEGSIIFVANNFTRALVENKPGSYVVPIFGSRLVDSTLNWRISAKSVNTCQDPNNIGCELHLQFKSKRPTLVIFAAIVAVIVNWLSTVFIFILTCEGVIMKRTHILHNPQLLAVCFTALFALPSVRSILPGAPDFGAIIDLIGIIPNVIIISLCTTMVAGATLRDRHHAEIHKPSHTHSHSLGTKVKNGV